MKPRCNKGQLLEREFFKGSGNPRINTRWRRRDDNPSRLDTQRGCYPSARGAYGADRRRDRSEGRSHHVCSFNTRPQSSDQAETVNIQKPLSSRPDGLVLIPGGVEQEASAAELLIVSASGLLARAASRCRLRFRCDRRRRFIAGSPRRSSDSGRPDRPG